MVSPWARHPLWSRRVLRQNFLTLGPELVPDSDMTTSLQFKDIDQTLGCWEGQGDTYTRKTPACLCRA